MLAFDPIRVMNHDFLRVSCYFAIYPKLYKRSEAVDRVGRRRAIHRIARRRTTSEPDTLKLEEKELLRENYYS